MAKGYKDSENYKQWIQQAEMYTRGFCPVFAMKLEDTFIAANIMHGTEHLPSVIKDLKQHLLKLNTCKSAGLDNLPLEILKKSPGEIRKTVVRN